MSEIGQKIIYEVRKIASLQPDHRYKAPPAEAGACLYMHGNEPGCIIGKALFNLGFLPTRENIEGISAGTVFRVLGIDLDLAESYWLETVQSAQDGARFTWSEAVIYADASPFHHPLYDLEEA